MDNMLIYNKVRSVPKEAQKAIGGGRLKGMTDINPMWRLKVLTETFGPVGKGWYYVIKDQWTEAGANDEIAVFTNIELYVKYDNEWSMPICGTGGSMFVTKEKNGPYTSDEAYKMALTDAISVACKSLGIGADIYFSSDRSKYDKSSSNNSSSEPEVKEGVLSPKQIARLFAIAKSAELDEETVKKQVHTKFNKSVNEMTKEEYDKVCDAYETIAKAKAEAKQNG